MHVLAATLRLFLALSLPCTESKGSNPCRLLSQGQRMGGTGGRERGIVTSPPFLQLHNLSGSSCCGAGPRGSSLHLVTILLSSAAPPLPSALQQYQPPVFAISGFLTAPWLASGLFHPQCNQSLHQSPSVSNSSVVSVSCLDPDLSTSLWSWTALIQGTAAKDQPGNPLLGEVCWKARGL